MSHVAATDSTFNTEVLEYKGVVLVDFWAPWCMPCQILGPIIEEVATEMEGKAKVVKLNIDEGDATATKYGILGVPTVIIFKDGEIVEKIPSLQAKEVYTQALKKHLG